MQSAVSLCMVRRGLPWCSERILPARRDWDHYIRKGKNRFVITVISPLLVNVCLARLFLAFRLWHKRWRSTGFICSLSLMFIGTCVRGFAHLLPDGLGCSGRWRPTESRDKGQSGLSVWAWRCHSDESALIAVTLEAFEISVILLITPFSPQPHLPKWPWGH